MGSLEVYQELSKKLNKVVIIMVEGDIASHMAIESTKLEVPEIHSIIITNLGNAIKNKKVELKKESE